MELRKRYCVHFVMPVTSFMGKSFIALDNTGMAHDRIIIASV